MTPPRAYRALTLVVLFVIYVVAGKLGLSLAFVNQSATAIWPPTGIALAAFLLGGNWVWPAVFAGAFVVNATTARAITPAVFIAIGNTLESAAGAWLVRRAAGGLRAFETAPLLLRYTACATCAAAIASTIGVAVLLWSGLARAPDTASIWLTWWLGDLSGALLVTPAIICWARGRSLPRSWAHLLEVTGMAIVLVVSCYIVFGPTAAGERHYPMMFFVLAVLVWVSLRFGRREVTVALLLTSTLSTAGTIHGYGPFGEWTPAESLLLLQAYLSVTAIVVLALVAEFTRRRSIEDEMRVLNEELAASVRVKDEFLATLSHELRTPINTVLGWSQMLRDNTLSGPLRSKAIEAIHRNVTIQAQLVSDILDVSRMRSGTLRIERSPVRLATVVEDALEVVRPMISAKNLALSISVPADIVLEGDGQRLQQILWNLLANAAKFTPNEGTVGLTATLGDRDVEIVVSDSGPGIDPAFLPYVFEPFRQADQGTTREYGGLGLGLAITRELVRLHGGSIAGGNHERGGAVFVIRLPIGA